MTLEDLLVREEGLRLYAYQDSLGYWTIGYGTLIDKRGSVFSEAAARFLLNEEIAAKKAEVLSAIPWIKSLSETRQTVLFAMAYQLGTAGLLAFRKTLAAVKAGDYSAAARGMRGSKWADQTPGRVERMAKAMETGELV